MLLSTGYSAGAIMSGKLMEKNFEIDPEIRWLVLMDKVLNIIIKVKLGS